MGTMLFSTKNVLSDLEQQGLGRVLRLALERYKRDETLGRVSQPLEPNDAIALGRLLGKTVRTLDLQVLDTALQKSKYQISLLEVLETLNQAPIISAKSQRLQLEQTFLNAVKTVTDPEWQTLLENGEAGASRIKRAIKEQQVFNLPIVAAALTALRNQPERLPSLATRVVGHAHALDTDTLNGQVLLEALSALNLEPPVRDGVSSSVLIANLLGFSCVHLPWREVINVQPINSNIILLENPAVFEALLDTGIQHPMICSHGQPSAACIALLDRTEGAIFFAADFDLGGLRIAKRIYQRYPTRFSPWHFDVNAYQTALTQSGGFDLSTNLEPFKTIFPELVMAMQTLQRGAHQEAILELFCRTIPHDQRPSRPDLGRTQKRNRRTPKKP
jgi:hypothetical protein